MKVVISAAFLLYFSSLLLCQEGWYGHPHQVVVQQAHDFNQDGFYPWSHHYQQKTVDRHSTYSFDIFHYEKTFDASYQAYLQLLEDRSEQLKKSVLSTSSPAIYTNNITLLNNDLLKSEQWAQYLIWSNFHDIDDPSELAFNQGYAYFQMRQSASALSQFQSVDDHHTLYPYTLYYRGFIELQNKNFEKATETLKLLQKNPDFSKDIPLILAQLLFFEKSYEEVTELSLSPLASKRNKINMAKVQGLAYFELENIDRAIPLFQNYIESSSQIQPEDYLLLGSAYYQKQNYSKAQEHLEKIAHRQEYYGQLANYYLGDIYMLKGEKGEARRSFLEASKAKINSSLSEQCLFYYGKLSSELAYDRDALVALRSFGKESSFFEQAQLLLADILISTSDYHSALKTISQLDEKSSHILKAEHQLLFFNAIELYNNNNIDQANSYWKTCIQRNDEIIIQSRSIYWLAESYYSHGELDEAKKHFQQYLKRSSSESDLINKAHYSLGYIALKKEYYNKALDEFKKVNNKEKSIYQDALVKIADLHFGNRDWTQAVTHYNLLIETKSNKEDYALFQKAMISGLQNKSFEKLVNLDEVILNHEDSRYRDDAIWEAAKTSLALGKKQDALSKYKLLIKDYGQSSPFIEEALNQAGLVSYNLGATKEAIDYYKKVFKFSPSAAERITTLRALEEIYLKELSRPDLYVDFVEKNKLGKINDYKKDSLSFIAGQYQFEQGKFSRSQEALEKYTADFPRGAHFGQTQYLLGEIYLNDKNYKAAVVAYEVACSSSDSKYDACSKIAEILYYHSKDYSKSLKFYRLAENIAQDEEESHDKAVGVLHCAFKLHDDSIILNYAEKILAHDKINDEDKLLAHFARSKALIRSNNKLKAVNSLNEVIEHSSGERAAESRYLIAQIYYENNQLSLAEKLCDLANKRNTGYHYWLGKGLLLYSDILSDLDEHLNARAALSAIISNFDMESELYKSASVKIILLDDLLNQINKLNEEE